MLLIRILFSLSPLLTALLIPIFSQTQQELPILNRPSLTVLDMQYSPDGELIAQIYANGRLEIFEIASGGIVLEDTPVLPNPLVSAKVDWSLKGDRLAAGIGSLIYIWDVGNARLLETVKAGGDEPLVYKEADYYVPEGFTSVQWDSTGTLLLAQSVSSRYTIWSIEKQAFIFDLTIGNEARPVVWLPGEQRISYYHNYLDIQAQERVARPTQDLRGLASQCGGYHANVSGADRSLMAWGTSNGCVIILDAETGNEIAGYKIAENDHVITGVSWSPDDSAIVAVDTQGGVQVIEVASGNVTLIEKVDGALYAVDWSAANSQIAYGGGTEDGETLFATVEVAEVERLMASDAARQAELVVTPPPLR